MSVTQIKYPLPVNVGGTGANNKTDARTNLGLEIGVDVQSYDADTAAIAGLSTLGPIIRTGAGTAATSVLDALIYTSGQSQRRWLGSWIAPRGTGASQTGIFTNVGLATPTAATDGIDTFGPWIQYGTAASPDAARYWTGASLRAELGCWLVFRVAPQHTTLVRYFFGITTEADMSGETPAGDFAGFSFSSAAPDTNWQMWTRDGTTPTKTDTGIAFDATAKYMLIGRTSAGVRFAMVNAAGSVILDQVVAVTVPRTGIDLRAQWNVDNTDDASVRSLKVYGIEAGVGA